MVEATCQCLLAQAEEGEKKDLDPVQIEKQVYLCTGLEPNMTIPSLN